MTTIFFWTDKCVRIQSWEVVVRVSRYIANMGPGQDKDPMRHCSDEQMETGVACIRVHPICDKLAKRLSHKADCHCMGLPACTVVYDGVAKRTLPLVPTDSWSFGTSLLREITDGPLISGR